MIYAGVAFHTCNCLLLPSSFFQSFRIPDYHEPCHTPTWPEKGWTIGEARHIEGYPVTLESLGAEVDGKERQQFHLFDGILDRSSALYPFQTPVPGFVLAEVFESKSKKLLIVVTYRIAGTERKRVI